MGTVALVISAILGIFFIYSLIYTILQPSEQKKGVLRPPKLISYIGSICGLLFLIPSVICAFETDNDVYASIGFLAFAFLSVILVINYMSTKITYDDYTFTYTDFFGRSSLYDYSEITSMDENRMDVVLRVGKKKISVDMISPGFADFLRTANIGYRRHHGRGIPPPDREKDLFRGNIKGTDELILGYSIGSVVILIVVAFLIALPFVEYDESDTELRETSFVSYKYHNNDIYFMASDGFEYSIRNYDDSTDIASVIALCDSGESLNAYCRKVNPKHGDDYYNLRALKIGDEFILTFEETNRLERNSNMFGIPFAIGFLIYWIITVVMTVVVGRNPKKYKKLLPLFFKKEQIR
jgi:hypothetical protein